jgi:excisionase family DNA binding protein
MDINPVIRNRPLTTGEIAEFCHVSLRAVGKWISSGKLKAYRTPGRHSRVEFDDFRAFLVKYNMPVPAGLDLPRKPGEDNKRRVLIVDDDRITVEFIRLTLVREQNYIVDVAYDGFEAGLKYGRIKPDLVILDIRMPKVDGFELCARIRKDTNTSLPRILAVSSLPGREWIRKIRDLGADDYLEKPLTKDALLRKIEWLSAFPAGRSGGSN